MNFSQPQFSLSQTMATTPRKDDQHQFSITSLLSPPESKRGDAFNSPVSMAMSRTPSGSFSSMDSFVQTKPNGGDLSNNASRSTLLSPPISPHTLQKQEMEKEDADGVADPPLFPSSQSSTADANASLFPEPESMDVDMADAAITAHIANKSDEDAAIRPTAAEYKLVADTLMSKRFVSCVFQEFEKDPQGWYRREQFTNYEYYKAQGPHKKGKTLSGKKVLTSPGAPYRKIAPAPFGSIRKARAAPLPRIRNNPKPKRASPPQRFYDDDFSVPLQSPSASKVPKAPSSRDDVDFEKIPDYSPPISTLPNNSKALNADWKGQKLDLSSDPNRHLLHDAEINLAATLRLTCAMYLCSKRRIFEARIHTLRIGKEFRKTDAQQACKIDVNKASKLWTAFDKVGWFDAKYFHNRV
jgi:hypothetical protein